MKCPKRHAMGWLGLVYWHCSDCRVIYVSREEGYIKRVRGGYKGYVIDEFPDWPEVG